MRNSFRDDIVKYLSFCNDISFMSDSYRHSSSCKDKHVPIMGTNILQQNCNISCSFIFVHSSSNPCSLMHTMFIDDTKVEEKAHNLLWYNVSVSTMKLMVKGSFSPRAQFWSSICRVLPILLSNVEHKSPAMKIGNISYCAHS